MMLQALAAFAERRIADDPNFFDPDFRWENAAWRIEVNRDGKLNGVIPLKVQDGTRWKLKRVRRPYTDVNEIPFALWRRRSPISSATQLSGFSSTRTRMSSQLIRS